LVNASIAGAAHADDAVPLERIVEALKRVARA
jgi:hypothetical protein